METNHNLEKKEWEYIELNFNDHVLVKLNSIWIKLREDYFYKKLWIKKQDCPLKIDWNWYTELQLWELMQIFGKEMYNWNSEYPFEMNFKIQTGKLDKIDDNKEKTSIQISDTLK